MATLSELIVTTSGPKMNPSYIIACLFLSLVTQPAGADVVYKLVDQGVPNHTLNGSFTVVDGAAADGILTTAEVTQWEVTVVGPTVHFAIDTSYPGAEFHASGTILIDHDRVIVGQRISDGSNRIIFEEFHDVDAGYEEHNRGGSENIGETVYLTSSGDEVRRFHENSDRVVAVRVAFLGDVNLDGFVDLQDVAPFVQLIANGGYQAEADINQDGVVDLLDVTPFVELLSGG